MQFVLVMAPREGGSRERGGIESPPEPIVSVFQWAGLLGQRAIHRELFQVNS